MAKRISRSNLHLTKEEVAVSYKFREKSLRIFFSNKNPQYDIDFTGLSENEVKEELANQLDEIEKDACMSLLACIEAKFRLDYIIRCEEKHKDNMSRKFRELFADYQYRISLEEGILEEWKNSPNIPSSVISNIKGAFKYRHWLAHGRYWNYKSIKYDFFGLYNLAIQVDSLSLKS